MYTYIMLRTQISLTSEERQALDAEAVRTGKSISALIRDAVERSYGTVRSSADDLSLMRQSFGSWTARNEDGASTEVLAGMRANEEDSTRSLLSIFIWHPVDTVTAERAGELGRRWLRSHQTIDSADLAIAATAMVTGCELLTCNVKHFPMFADLRKPY